LVFSYIQESIKAGKDQYNEGSVFEFSDFEWCLDWMKNNISTEEVEDWEFLPSEHDEGEKITFHDMIEELESYAE
jgi:hypothetical protein